jgi:hypothetical protein
MNDIVIPSGVRKSYTKSVYKWFLSELTQNMKPSKFKVGDMVLFPKSQTRFRGGWEIWYPDLFPQMDLNRPYKVTKVTLCDSWLHETLFYRNGCAALDDCKTTWSLRSKMYSMAGQTPLYWVLHFDEVPFLFGYAEYIFGERTTV